MEIEYRHAFFRRIYGNPCFFRTTKTDIAAFLLSYYQDKGLFAFSVKYIFTENLYLRKNLEGNHMCQNKNISAKWEICVILQRL